MTSMVSADNHTFSSGEGGGGDGGVAINSILFSMSFGSLDPRIVNTMSWIDINVKYNIL
jgi:hypothetical protein